MELRFYIYYNGGAAVLYSPQFNITWTSYRGSVRIYGDNRYETAGLIADRKLFAEGKDKYDHVIIASGLDFADALGGSYLAKAADAPMLLVNKDPAVMKDTAQDIAARLKDDGFVFILGGTGAVSEDMETELKAAGLTHIKRFAGKNRYDTNLQIIEFCNQYSYVDHRQMIICSGRNFADALSASATGYPIMLVGDTLNDDQFAYFMEDQPYIVIAGGTGAVSEAVEEELFKGFELKGWRLEGKDRYETSNLVAEYFFPHQPYNAVLAYGRNFPDGLSGGPLAQTVSGPLLLVDDNHYMDAEDYVNRHDPREYYVLGGPALISDATVTRIMERSDF